MTYLDNTKLSFKAKGIYAFLQKNPDFNASAESLAKVSKEGISSISTGLNELRTLGYLEHKYVHGKNGKFLGSKTLIREPKSRYDT